MLRRHAIRAFLVAPLVAPAVAFVLLSLGGSAFDDFPKLQLAALVFAIAIAFVSYAHAFALGLPLALWLLRRGMPTVGTSALCGAVVGALPLTIVAAYQEIALPIDGSAGASRLSSNLVWITMFSLCGLLSGIAWWIKLDAATSRERLNAA